MAADPPVPEDLRVTSPSEITAYLQQMFEAQTGVLVAGPQGHSLTSRVCAFDADAEVFGLALGADPDGVSQTLVASGEITGVAYLGSIRLQFELDNAVLVSGDRGTVLRSALPTRLYRFQRRQAFRVQPAGSLFPRLVLPRAMPDAATAQRPQTPTEQATDRGMDSTSAMPDAPERTLRVLDLSVGGLALAVPVELEGWLTALPLGQVIPGLTLELDRTTGLKVSLMPHHLSLVDGHPGGMQQLGCAFVALDTAAGRSLQVYVDQTQKRRRLLRLDPP